jgi:large subunit ribosomal protein L14e
MFEVGTVCVKLAGRDSGKKCVVIEAPKDGIVVIEGETRRRKCNIRHLYATGESAKVKAGANHAEVMKALGLKEKESKVRKPAAKPSAHASRAKPKAEEPKKSPKKAAAKKKSEAKDEGPEPTAE